jgi:hypothetical protein
MEKSPFAGRPLLIGFSSLIIVSPLLTDKSITVVVTLKVNYHFPLLWDFLSSLLLSLYIFQIDSTFFQRSTLHNTQKGPLIQFSKPIIMNVNVVKVHVQKG